MGKSSLTYTTDLKYIYTGVDNGLKLIITNNTGSVFPINNLGLDADEYPTYAESKTISNAAESRPSGFYLYFSYGDKGEDIVSVKDSTNISISATSDDAQSEWYAYPSEDDDIGMYWIVAPLSDYELAVNKNIEISISRIKCNNKPDLAPIYIEYRSSDGDYCDEVLIKKVEKSTYALDYSVTQPTLTVDQSSNFFISITNKSDKKLKFSNNDKLTREDAPRYDAPEFDSPDANVLMSGFYVYFKYGPHAAHLVEKLHVEKIKQSMLDGVPWSINFYPASTVGPYFLIIPDETISLEGGDDIRFEFRDVLSNKKPGQTSIYIEFRSDGRIKESTLPLQKYSVPCIRSFFIVTPAGYNIGDNVDFEWELAEASACKIKVNGRTLNGPALSFNTPIEDREYELEVINPAGFIVREKIDPQFTFFESFAVIAADGKNVTVAWKKTENTKEFKIKQWEIVGSTTSLIAEEFIHSSNLEGKMLFPAKYDKDKEATFRFTATATGIGVDGRTGREHNKEEEKETIEFKYPKIISFGKTADAISWKTENVAYCVLVFGDDDRIIIEDYTSEVTSIKSLGKGTYELRAYSFEGYGVPFYVKNIFTL